MSSPSRTLICRILFVICLVVFIGGILMCAVGGPKSIVPVSAMLCVTGTAIDPTPESPDYQYNVVCNSTVTGNLFSPMALPARTTVIASRGMFFRQVGMPLCGLMSTETGTTFDVRYGLPDYCLVYPSGAGLIAAGVLMAVLGLIGTAVTIQSICGGCCNCCRKSRRGNNGIDSASTDSEMA